MRKYTRPVYNGCSLQDLKGLVFDKVYKREENPAPEFSNEAIVFENKDEKFILTHWQDCCESVVIEEIHGDLEDLAGASIVQAEEEYKNGSQNGGDLTETWSFYKFATIKGYVTIRFYGTSNGYYSESAGLFKLVR